MISKWFSSQVVKMPSVADFAHCLTIGLALSALPALAEQSMTRLVTEQTDAGQRVRSVTMIGDSFVAFLSENDQLSSLYNSDTKQLWLLNHDQQTAQFVNETEVHRFAIKLTSEVARFETSIASLPPEQQELSRQRLEQLFERAGNTPVSYLNDFVPNNRADEFAGIKCQWHDMVAHHRTGEKLVARACLAGTDVFTNGSVLAAYFNELSRWFDIVRNAGQGAVPFPVADNPMTLTARQGMVAMKMIPDAEFDNSDTGMEVISVSTVAHSTSDYEVPDSYQRQGFSETLQIVD